MYLQHDFDRILPYQEKHRQSGLLSGNNSISNQLNVMSKLLFSQEEISSLSFGEIEIIQPKSGYRFSIDPILLCDFLIVTSGAGIIDLGTGNGIIPLILAHRDKAAQIVALERQPLMADRARRSVALNGLQDRIKVVQGDVRDLPSELGEQPFDIVIMNPPYRAANTGRIAPNDERAAARHELAGNYLDFLQAAVALLGTGGRVFVIFLAERMAELLSEMRNLKLEPKRLRLVHSRQGEDAKLVLIEGRKNGKPGLNVEPPLFIYKGKGRDYTEEVLKMYG